VVGELISLPIDLWVKQIQSKDKFNLEVWKGSQMVFQKLIFFDEMSAYQKIEVPLQASKIGTYPLHIRFGKKVTSDLTWEVVGVKARVDGFAPGPHPDLGVISRIATQQLIRINWHFGESIQVKPSMKNLIFYEKRPQDLASLQNHSVWYLSMELPNSFVVNSSSLHRKEVHFWDEQMEAYRNQKSFSKIDSMFNRLFAQTFLRNIQEDTLVNKEISNENPASLIGRNEEKLAYLGRKDQVDFSIQGLRKAKLSKEIKSVPIWRHPYAWLVLVILIFVEWGIRKRYL
jgi:ABC-type sugar transport system ATPase subunit